MDKAKTLGNTSAVKCTPDKSIDPALLFQRLIVISMAVDLSLEDALKYQLCPFPSGSDHPHGISAPSFRTAPL